MVEEFIDIPYFMTNDDWYYYDAKGIGRAHV